MGKKASAFETAYDLYNEGRLEEAFPYLQQAYDEGDMNSCLLLGDYYYSGEFPGSEGPDVEKALKIYEEGMNEGFVWCVLQWCNAHIERGIDDPRIVPYLEAIATEEGDEDPNAAYLLHVYYKELQKDMEKAGQWLQTSKDLGWE